MKRKKLVTTMIASVAPGLALVECKPASGSRRSDLALANLKNIKPSLAIVKSDKLQRVDFKWARAHRLALE